MKKTILVSAFAFLAMATAAMAAPGVATTTVNVRSGPGTGFSIVDKLQPGERVDIAHCANGWCYVGKSGTDGWVSSDYLEKLPVMVMPPPVIVHPPIVVRPPVHVVRPPVHRPPAHKPPPHKPPHKPGKPTNPNLCKPGQKPPCPVTLPAKP